MCIFVKYQRVFKYSLLYGFVYWGKKLTHNLSKTLKIKKTIPTYICFYFLNRNEVWTFLISTYRTYYLIFCFRQIDKYRRSSNIDYEHNTWGISMYQDVFRHTALLTCYSCANHTYRKEEGGGILHIKYVLDGVLKIYFLVTLDSPI